MAVKTLLPSLKLLMNKAPIVVAASYEGTAIARAGYGNTILAVLLGTSADTLDGSNYITLTLEECATSGGSYTTCADADVVCYKNGTLQSTNAAVLNDMDEDNILVTFEYIGAAAFLHLQWTETGTISTGAPRRLCWLSRATRCVSPSHRPWSKEETWPSYSSPTRRAGAPRSAAGSPGAMRKWMLRPNAG